MTVYNNPAVDPYAAVDPYTQAAEATTISQGADAVPPSRPEFETNFPDQILKPVPPRVEAEQARARSLQARVKISDGKNSSSDNDEDVGFGYQPTLAHSPTNQTPRMTFDALAKVPSVEKKK